MDGAVQVTENGTATVTVTNTYTKDAGQEPGGEDPQEPTPVTPPQAEKWDLSKSKEATNLDGNYESDVTLSLPAGDYERDLDVVFVIDKSHSTDHKDYVARTEAMLQNLLNKNLNVKVGVVIFSQIPAVAADFGPLTADTLETYVKALTMAPGELGLDVWGTNLQGGIKYAERMLASDVKVDDNDKYMVILSDGASRMWLNDADEPMSQTFMQNDSLFLWGSNQDFASRYIEGTPACSVRSFTDIWNAGETGNIAEYAMSEADSKEEEAKNLAADWETVCSSDDYYTSLEVATYYTAKEIISASSQYHVLFTTFRYQSGASAGHPYNVYTESFKDWLEDNGYITRYATEKDSSLDAGTVLEHITDDLIQLVDAGSYVVDVIGNDVDENDVAYDFDFINDIDRLTLTVGGVEQSKTKITDTSYGFGSDGQDGYAFVVTYYKDGTTIGSKTYDECFIWNINVAVTKDAPVQLTYGVKLTNPQTTAGTYGQYDKDGSKNYTGLYTNNSATLFPVDSDQNPGTPEDFNKPTVKYTVTTPTPDPDPTPTPSTTSLTVTKVWADNGDEAQARPDDITVTLLRDGEDYSTYTLNESNGWKHTFSGLSTNYTWSVAEADVPEGYTSEVSGSGTVWTITNTYELSNIDDPNTPLDPGPGGDDEGGEIDIDDPGTPLAPAPGDEGGNVDIGEGDVPLSDAPQTGDSAPLLILASLLAISGGAVLTLSMTGKKKEN